MLHFCEFSDPSGVAVLCGGFLCVAGTDAETEREFTVIEQIVAFF